ncbi:MAG: acyltransferase [Dissulfuribacterales bacterium]
MSTRHKYFKHEKALVESENIGKGTRVWAFAHILPKARIGKNCNICDHTFIENDVVIGDNVTIKCGVQLWDGLVVEDNVFIGPNATFTNDIFPRSKKYPDEFKKTVLKKNCSIGANATVLCGIEIGENAMVGAGSVVTKSIPPRAVVYGNPAKIQHYLGENDE